jgi:hypothetical protein
MGDLNARIGSQRLGKIIGATGEPTVNRKGTKLTDVCCFNEFITVNKYFIHQDTHKFMWQAQNTKSLIDCKLEMRK